MFPPQLILAERKDDFCANLQLCCDHYRSVSEVCRRLKINRQQFNRYLAGTAFPSRHNYKLISDFFGLEPEHLFMPSSAFAASFKPRTMVEAEPASRRWDDLRRAVLGLPQLAEYQGFYFKYFYTYLGGHRIKRELVHWYGSEGMLVSSVKQRYLGEDEGADASSAFITYRGIVGSVGDRLINIDYHRGTGREVSTMFLYPRGRKSRRMNGLTVSVSHGPARAIAAARVVMDFIGTEIDRRVALSGLGSYDLDDASVPATIKRAVLNDLDPGETLFAARHR
ncbi:helix-turn-helix transcriptional regulator [Mesorhizobium sp. B2-4-18]|uniref:helix-turn-helix domain-containing protein n=1 Tax=Mesorhizobium sp. B2-4-18 TaxID=2589931 RepID=UPI0011298CC1|nr:helix-turn-helix transcriptional regulator [Mesorhizobium sp. B2-4-18]TPK71898.1 helix-turn-helix transcriptional regulator [Mesorhizobium sp. B2-4-18]